MTATYIGSDTVTGCSYTTLLDSPHMRGVPDEQIRITVDCQHVASRIVAGLREHKSQLHVMSDDPANTWQWERRVRREWYTIAWPEPDQDAPMLTNLFEGLD